MHATAAMVGVAPLAKCADPPENRLGDYNTKVGMIGLGPQGRFLTERFRQVSKIVALCDVHTERLSVTSGMFKENAPSKYAHHEDLLAHPG